MKETKLIFYIHKSVSMIIIVYSWYLGGEDIHISIMKQFRLATLKTWMLYLVHQYHLDQELSKSVLVIRHIKLEGATPVQKQHLYIDQLINKNWI